MKSNKDIKILIIDDEPCIVKFLKIALMQKDYSVTTASNGAEALEKVYLQKPNVILLDVMMPEMDGYEVCRKIKSYREFNNTIVILLSAKIQKNDIIKGMRSGANCYITKPFRITQVIKTISQQLENIEELYSIKNQLDRFTLLFNSEIKYLKMLNSITSRLFAKTNLSEEDILGIKLCLDEIGTNAIKHGNENDPIKMIKIDYILEPDKLQFIIEDEGIGFDFNSLKDPTLENNLMHPGGRGIFLVKQLMDKLEFFKNGKKVLLTKYLK